MKKGRKDQPPNQDDIDEQEILQEMLAALQSEKEQQGPTPVGVQDKHKNGKRIKRQIQQKAQVHLMIQIKVKLQSKNYNYEDDGSITPDRAGKPQPRDISVEISHWNGEEERADEDGSLGDGGKDWRIDIQREKQWNGRQDQKNYINIKTDRERRFHKYWILSEIQRLKHLIKIRAEQNCNHIQCNERRGGSLPRNVDGRIGRRNSNTNLTESSEMLQSYIPNLETQLNIEKDSGCKLTEQSDREITLQNAWTRGSTISSKLSRLCNITRPQISISPHHSISKLKIIPNIKLQQQQLRIQSDAFWDQTQSNFLPEAKQLII
ncbi:MAG: hypothetical protein EZS28_007309 [Streblomastix strix]|uniref:Uncharacterized protein n=1 Tax=Streblomastix strix TaxID=222440 RepID=A0A5J4WQF4_9EUKA|nr:MAG: hypothetical protein EZS28_007309 [Streblomastix strix]